MEAHAVYSEPFVKSERDGLAEGLRETPVEGVFHPSSLLMFAFLIKDETPKFISIGVVEGILWWCQAGVRLDNRRKWKGTSSWYSDLWFIMVVKSDVVRPIRMRIEL